MANIKVTKLSSMMDSAIISIRNLRFAYPDSTEALKGINLDIREGESIGIIGPNGAGKTTLLLHLNGIARGSGTVEVCGIGINNKNLYEIRRLVSIVFQDPEDQLFMPTVFDDVAFGPINMGLDKGDVRNCVRNALKAVGMPDSAERVSHHLSFGEKKEIAIATVLAMQPQIIALDEPSSNLDPRGRRRLINLLRGLRITKLIAGHDLELILTLCERTYVLDGGEIVASGPTRDILGDGSLMEAHGLEVPASLK